MRFSHRGRPHLLMWFLPVLSCPLLLGAGPDDAAILNAQYDIAVKECVDQVENGRFDACLSALNQVAVQVSGGETDVKQELRGKVKMRMDLVEARKKAGSPTGERPDLYYKTIFKAYASSPEKYFPYEEVLPIWNAYLREDIGRSKFARYRKLKLIARASKEDKALEDAFFTGIQPRLLEFGFNLLDPTTSDAARPDVLLKVDLKGGPTEEATDPKLRYKKVYRVTMDISSFKFMSANASVDPRQVELEAGANTHEIAREQLIQQSADRLTNLLFYHTLRQMFQATEAPE